MILRPVAGHGVDEDVAHVELVGVERQVPDALVVLDGDGDSRYSSGRDRGGEEVSHLAGIAAQAGLLELNLAEDAISGEFVSSA